MQNESPTLVILIAASILASLIYPVSGLPLNGTYLSPIGEVIFSTTVPDSPDSTTAYRVNTSENISSYYSSEELEKIRNNVTSEADAPAVSQQILENYGGMPSDAKLTYVATEYLEKINGSSEKIEEQYPISTNVQYARSIDGNPVVGEGAFINIELGDNGELLYLNKVWRSVTPDGNISIQPVTTAIEKLRRGEVLNPKSYPYNVNITRIRLGYYEKGRNQSQEYLEPAWLFRGTTESGDSIKYYIYARKFANFTASSTNISTFQTVRFSDTSETIPIKWHWDFGDGTNSTEQNPAHTYRTSGNFTVNLTAWNDLGGDTESKTGYMNVTFTKPLNADFNATPRNASTGDAIQFSDASDTSPIKWYWEFGDGRNSTLRNPTHAYTASGNFTVNLTVWNTLGSDTRSIENYLRIYPDPRPVSDFISNYTSGDQYPPCAIMFNDTSAGFITNWSWDFGDGTNSTEQNPVHVFTVLPGEIYGDYTIRLTVTDIFGRSSVSEDNNHWIIIKKGFSPDFSAEPREGSVPLNVTFTDQTTDSEKAMGSVWDFGDGEYYSHWGQPLPETVPHEYQAEGNYSVSLRYIGPREDSYWSVKEFYISVRNATGLPIPDFTANTTSGKAPLIVAFTDTSTGIPNRWSWDFGDGAISPEKNPVHDYTVPGTYPVSLNATNIIGSNSTTKIDYIVVLPRNTPTADFTANITGGKMPLVVAFSDTSTNSPVNWSWDFGDETNSTEQNPVHVYTLPGKYTVSLRVMNDDGSDEEIKGDYITVLTELPELTIVPQEPVLPEADFTALPVSGKEPLTVIFNDTSSGYPLSWSWTFGDGETSLEKDPVHTYMSAGTYTVALDVTNPYGDNSTTRIDYITVLPITPPLADFTVNTSSGNIPLAVAFTDTSSNSPTSWSWTFGDGGESAEQNPVHVYMTSGQFTVVLQVTNEDGGNTTTKEQFISAGVPVIPVAEFTANLTSGTAPLVVGFTDQSSGLPVNWNWAFGDSATSAEQNPSHTYTNTGTYSVSLEVTSPDGSNTTTKYHYITVTSGTLPVVAKFTGKPTCGKAPLTVRFNDSSTGSPTSWYWDFGDGTNAIQQNPVHVYTVAGKFTVSLTATNAGGSNTSTRKDYITVSGTGTKPPVANFYAKPTSGKAPLSVTFTDTSTGFPTGWYWDFGDGTNATERNPVHSYTSPGKYTLSLTVTNAGGSNTKTRTEYITVKGTPPPTANFYGKPTSGKAPLSVTFTDTSTGFPTGWYWEFGDGRSDAAQHPVHTYTEAGRYTVSLTAFNTGGNTTKTRTQYITVRDPVPTTSPTCTQSQCEPDTIPAVRGSIENGKIRLDWDVITSPCLQGYKVVISKDNPNPKYPDDGYMFWITDRYRNYSVISSADHYNGGDFGEYLQPDQAYYFSITAVYTTAKVAGNAVELVYPSSGTPTTTATTFPTIKPTTTCTTKPVTTCTMKPS